MIIHLSNGHRRAQLDRLGPELVRWRVGEGDQWGEWTEGEDVGEAVRQMVEWTMRQEDWRFT